MTKILVIDFKKITDPNKLWYNYETIHFKKDPEQGMYSPKIMGMKWDIYNNNLYVPR